jgi:hypothetical protein
MSKVAMSNDAPDVVDSDSIAIGATLQRLRDTLSWGLQLPGGEP